MKCLLLACLVSVLCPPVSVAKRPNIVFILADDLGWADTTLYGHTKLYRTPHLDRLSDRGMTFTRAYSASPLCSPTRASILTGQHPARIGLTTPNCHTGPVVLKATPGTKGNPGKKAVGPNPVSRLDTKYFTLAECLKEAGYVTGHFGKWHLGMTPHSALEHGFDVDIPHWPGPGPAGSFVAPWRFPDFDPNTPKEHIEDRMAEEAVKFLEQNKDRPFFLNYWMFSVHAPFDAKAALIGKYRKLVDPEDPQRSPTYAAMIESMDDAVGTLLDALDRLGLAENTIIVFFSDNGGNMYNEVDGTSPTSNAPLRGGKATMFEGGVRVPMVVSWPGHVQPDTSSDTIVQSTDFFPTFLELLGLEAMPGQVFDGVSIAPVLSGQGIDRAAIFTYFPHDPPVPDWIPPSISVHQGDWKLIREFYQGGNGTHRYRLFNLRDDLGEKKNIARHHPELVRRLDQIITDFLTDTKAVLPVPNPVFDPAKYRPDLEGINKVRGNPKPTRGKAPAKDDPFDPKLKGWKARHCKYEVANSIVTVKSPGGEAFLGTGAGLSGPATVTFRIRSPEAGQAKVEWLDQKIPPESVPFSTRGGDWETISVEVPAKRPLGILRIYLPPADGAVEVDWIDIKGTPKSRRTDF